MPVAKTRLEKLLALLEGGETSSIRRAAAQQIAGFAKSSPVQLYSIICRVWKVLHSKKWESRIAAGLCLRILTDHVQHHSVEDLFKSANRMAGHKDVKKEPQPADGLSLDTFDLRKLLEKGMVLVQSGGQEYDLSEEGLAPAEKLEQQRKALKSRLKLGGHVESVMMDIGGIIEEEDVASETGRCVTSKQAGNEADTILSDMRGLSARERNQLKRRAKQAVKSSGEAASKKQKLESQGIDTHSSGHSFDAELEWQEICSGAWPLLRVADQLLVDCLNPAWEIRHGSLLALREILSAHANCAAVKAPVVKRPSGWAMAGGRGKMELEMCSHMVAQQAAGDNAAWIEDCIVHLVCVLALDRFGDYVSDQVVAPVRETAAQALGAASRALPESKVPKLVALLCQLQEQADWSVRHGGLLGIKYLLAARHELAPSLLPTVLPAAHSGLQDAEEDVRAVAAESLLPAASAIAAGKEILLVSLQSTLWDILLTLDDLNQSTGYVMQLLAALYESGSRIDTTERLQGLVPRLWPFFQHALTNVRSATYKCMASILESSGRPCLWLCSSVLTHGLRLVYQALLLETEPEIYTTMQVIWREMIRKAPEGSLSTALQPEVIACMLDLAAVGNSTSLDPAKLHVAPKSDEALPGTGPISPAIGSGYLQILDSFNAVRARFRAGQALGELASACPSGRIGALTSRLTGQLSTQSASAQQLVALTAISWSRSSTCQEGPPPPAELKDALLEAIVRPKSYRTSEGKLVTYTEMGPAYASAHNAASRLLKQFAAHGVDVSAVLQGMAPEQYACMLTAENTRELSSLLVDKGLPDLMESKASFANTAESVINKENALRISVSAAVASAIVQGGRLPSKMNVVVQPLMAALRRDPEPLLQSTAAAALAELMHICSKLRPSLNNKIISNLSALVCSGDTEAGESSEAKGEDAASRKAVEAAKQCSLINPAQEGGLEALKAVAKRFGSQLLVSLPKLAAIIDAGLQAQPPNHVLDSQAAIQSLQVLRALGPHVPPELHGSIQNWFCLLPRCLRHESSPVRWLAAKCAAAVVRRYPHVFLPELLRTSVSMMIDQECQAGRQGAVQLVSHLIEMLKEALVPYLYLLVLPMMGCMSDQSQSLRLAAASCFAGMVTLLPLAQGLEPPDNLGADQKRTWLKDSELLMQLTDSSQVEAFDIPFKIAGSLRPYQTDGINWLAFLQRCGLHGVLADDMGLGKTLQATTIVAASHVNARSSGLQQRPSLIICPQVLVGHWPFEMAKFVDTINLRALAYEGPPSQRHHLRASLSDYDVLVMSYETLRVDLDWVKAVSWNYCILDEGHIIRNPRSKTAQAVKQIAAKHRLILSGTPIQNNVQDLWALFDFLMPGFLGDERAFNRRFGKALQVAKTSKAGSKEAQAGLLGMDELHKQVMPFILRRTKDSVLSDLPPKILQDVYCTMSRLQAALYDDFSGSSACNVIHGKLSTTAGQSIEDATKEAPHIFQALQYLRKLCSHPLLVLQQSNTSHVQAAMDATGADNWEAAHQRLHDLQHAPKLVALQDLLQQCGIVGVKAEGDDKAEPVESSGSHRVLVFAQFKSLLDLIERDVIEPNGISHLRLDGSVEAGQRFNIVQRFNQDPSVSVLLLTTSVGGLGLNLTAADTVIFMEHDWNPMKDLQAMDRAHRLGQTRTVNVYRLLIRDSLEDRIMGLQRFKVDVANAVINQENVSLSTMDTSSLLDSLQREKAFNRSVEEPPLDEAQIQQKTGSLKAVLKNLEELWDESQYAEEFALDSFITKLS